ncbi:MAG: hypothetical protein PHE36_11530 [Novosphingobium sp.]|nr:hypothetical protein [Novosphingobium sp.]
MSNRATPFLLAAVLVCAGAAPGTALASAPLTPAQQFKLRCAAAFSLTAAGQARGDPAMAAYPSLAERGREYFVRASAEAMDGAGLTREELAAHLQAEAAALGETDELARAMPLCLASLEASGL